MNEETNIERIRLEAESIQAGFIKPQIEEDDEEPTISDLLILWNNIKADKQGILEREEIVKNKVKAYLKERKWKKYLDKETDISISITESKRESIDKLQLKMLLNDTDYNSVVKTTIFERLNILTKETRKKLQKLVR